MELFYPNDNHVIRRDLELRETSGFISACQELPAGALNLLCRRRPTLGNRTPMRSQSQPVGHFAASVICLYRLPFRIAQ